MALYFSATLTRSRYTLALLVILHACAGLAMFLFLGPRLSKADFIFWLGMAVALLVVILFRHYYLCWLHDYRHLQLSSTGQLSLTQAADIQRYPDLLQADLLSTSSVHRYVIVLHFPKRGGGVGYLVLFPDMLSDADWSHLQVCLRHRLS